MNFLQLCAKVYIQGGISGQITSTQNQTGEALRVVNFVQDAYREILNSDQFTFGFIRKEVHKQLVPGQGTYTKAELHRPANKLPTRYGGDSECFVTMNQRKG